jgi:hypothetical protein
VIRAVGDAVEEELRVLEPLSAAEDAQAPGGPVLRDRTDWGSIFLPLRSGGGGAPRRGRDGGGGQRTAEPAPPPPFALRRMVPSP